MSGIEDYGPGNHGRWGPDDQRGTLNLITEAEVLKAASLVRSGRVVHLGMTLTPAGPVFGNRDKPWHYVRYQLDPQTGYADDLLVLNSHTGTHLDGLSHGFLNGHMYNGWLVADNVSSFGVKKNAIANVGGIVTRGVLLDVAGFLGQPHLEPGFAVTPQLLEECETAMGVRVGRGDACLVRTGWAQVTRDQMAEGSAVTFAQPGLTISVAQWFHERQAAVIGADNAAVDVLPGEEGTRPFGLHPRVIARQGGYLLEFLDLEELAEAGATEFLLVVAPLLLKGGTGSPVNPLAVL